MEQADTLIEARWIVPVEPAGAVLESHAVALRGSDIVGIGPTADIAARFRADKRVKLDEHVLIPGLVNLHTHAPMALMRGLADDLALMDWLRNHIWPAETQLVSPAFVRDGTLLACAEMLRGGITCFGDMYFFPDAVAQAALEAGMRAALGMIVIEMPSPYAGDARGYLAKGLAMRDAFRDEPLLSFCIAPHAPYTVSDSTFERIATYAAELDLPIHMHLHETDDEIRESIAAHHTRPIARLERLGILGPGLIGVHAVHLNEGEIDLLAQHGCSVAHCPSSNLKLGSGIAPVRAMLAKGINVGLGTDGAASNNRLDILTELRTAALLAKGASGDATAVPAHTALHMATLAGARALGIDERVGSLRIGKRADITAVRVADLELTPLYDPVSHLVYVAGREHVTHVWVNGDLKLEDRNLTGIDTRELHLKAALWKERIQARDRGVAIE
jgi:5-methylthioadenosine/S-adenosylhomocysteine deaminase